MKINLIILDKRNMNIERASYDRETRLASIYGKRFIKKSLVTKYLIDPDHIYYRKTVRGIIPFAIVDVSKRRSVSSHNPTTLGSLRNSKPSNPIEGESVSLHSEDQIDEQMKNMLDYMTESRFWQALMIKARTPLIQILLFMLAGAGLYSFIRMLLSAMGVMIP